MSSMMNHKKRSHRSEKRNRSALVGMKRYAPRCALTGTYDLTANMSHLLRRLRGRKRKGESRQDGADEQ